MKKNNANQENEETNLEIDLLLDAVKKKYGYDFKNYTNQVVKRVLFDALNRWNFQTISEMIPKILYDREFFYQLVTGMSNTVTEMFRDPSFYSAIRSTVIPHLRANPVIKVWHAGCATGEEVYSMAIVFKEEGLLERTQFYGTDFNLKALKIAKKGCYSLDRLRGYSQNYNQSGGKDSFSNYYDANYEEGCLDKSLLKHIAFAHHDLMLDGSLGEMQMVVCRNVLIYFEKKMKDQVLKMFSDSLVNDGVLCLGRDESLTFSSSKKSFFNLNSSQKIYLKQEG